MQASQMPSKGARVIPPKAIAGRLAPATGLA